jgi:hypothetical protein
MNFQSIAAALEVPINTALAGATPPVKIFFDNVVPVAPDAPKEYVKVNISFGSISESTLECTLQRARGAIVIRIYTMKDAGALRARQLSSLIQSVFNQINAVKKGATGISMRIQDIEGPLFYQGEKEPQFMARIEASWQASNIT